MSKKKEYEAYKQGMADGAAPFEKKFEEQSGHLKRVEKNIKHGMNCIDEAMDEVMDVCEEHDERINQIEHGDCERVKALSDGEKEILAGLVVMLSNKFSYNVHQVSFMNSLLALLEIEYDNVVEKDISCIEQLSDINAHKMIYQVLCEIMFLVNENTEYSDDFNDMCNDYFAITPRAKEAILLEIEKTYNTLGKKKYIDKYKQTIVEKKAQKVYPKLEIDMNFNIYEREIYSNFDLDGFDVNAELDLLDRNFRSESGCRDAYAELLRRPLRNRDAYIEEHSNVFIGNEITEHYALQIELYINKIYDYVNIHKVRMDISEILELRDECRKDIAEYTKEVIRKLPALYRMESFSYYKEMLGIEEEERWVDSLFGGGKEVTCYTLGFSNDCNWAVEQMAKEVTQLITAVGSEVAVMVSKKYIARINNCVLQINQLLGNA